MIYSHNNEGTFGPEHGQLHVERAPTTKDAVRLNIFFSRPGDRGLVLKRATVYRLIAELRELLPERRRGDRRVS